MLAGFGKPETAGSGADREKPGGRSEGSACWPPKSQKARWGYLTASPNYKYNQTVGLVVEERKRLTLVIDLPFCKFEEILQEGPVEMRIYCRKSGGALQVTHCCEGHN